MQKAQVLPAGVINAVLSGQLWFMQTELDDNLRNEISRILVRGAKRQVAFFCANVSICKCVAGTSSRKTLYHVLPNFTFECFHFNVYTGKFKFEYINLNVRV